MKENIDRLIKNLPNKEVPVSDFNVVKKALKEYEAPDKPISTKKK